MTTIDLVNFSVSNLRRRKNRTTLTVLGIVLGAALIILMISLGLGSAAATDEMIKTWGDLTTIQVYNAQPGATTSSEHILNDSFLENLRNQDNVVAATPKEYFSGVQGEIQTKDNKYACDLFNIIGIDAASIQPMGYALDEGAYLSETYLGKDTIPVMASQYAAYDFHAANKDYNSPGYMRNLYDMEGNLTDENPFFNIHNTQLVLRMKYNLDGDENYEYKDYKLVVVGTLQSDLKSGQNVSGFYMRLADMRKLNNEYNRLSSITDRQQSASYEMVYVKIDDMRNVDSVEKNLKEMGFETYSMNQVRKDMQSQALQGQLTLAGIAAVSLIVAAMNIINTMNTSILERIKEIGIMKVIGCSPATIRTMFLLEAAFIGMAGGILGAVCGVTFGAIINQLPKWSAEGSGQSEGLLSFFGANTTVFSDATQLSIIPVWLVAFTILFTTIIGIAAGLAPAFKAVKVSSLEAIRNA